MKISDVAKLIDAKIYCCSGSVEKEVRSACGCDMMSDVLAYVKDQSVLLTGLVNPQVIRTAEMMDIICIAFVRGKVPTEQMIELAEERGIVLMSTDMRLYPACGTLYVNGLCDGEKT